MSLQELQAQRANFIAAHAIHKITKEQLDAALAYNQKQIDALMGSSQQQAPVTPAQTATVPSQPVSAMPAEFPAQQFTDQSGNTNAPEETMSLQELQSQRANFIAAHAIHKITKEQLDAALAYNQKQIDALKASSQQQAAPAPQPAPAPVSPMPSEVPKQTFTDQSGTTNAPEELPERLQVIPTAMGPIPVKTFEAGAKDPTMQNIVIPAMEVAGIAALSAFPGAAPVVIGGAVAGVGLDIGIKSVANQEINPNTGKAEWAPKLVLPSSVREITDTALLSAGLSAVGGGAFGAVAKVAPSIAGQTASFAARTGTRAAINAGLGGGVSGIASGGDPLAIAKGAALGAGLGLAGEVAGPIAGKTAQVISKTNTGKAAINAISNVKENIFGTKFTEITGVREVAVQSTHGKTTIIKQITEPITKDVTIRGKDAVFYKESNLSSLRNPKIELAGTEKVYAPDIVTGGKTVEPIPILRQTEATRTATPILEALKGNTEYKMGAVKTGRSGNFLETPSDVPALQRTKVWVRTDKGQPNAILAEKTVVTSKPAILPETKISVRDYSGVKIRGTPDAQIYADPAKALPTEISQDIYKKLGGNYRPIVDFGKTTKNTSGAMKPGSNEFFKDAAFTKGKGSNAAKTPEIKVVEKAQVVNKEVSLPRAIVGEAKPSVASRGSAWTNPVGTISIWSRQRQTQPEIVEETPVSYPKDSPLQSPETISEISTVQQGKQNGGLTPINIIPEPTRTDDWSIPVVPDPVKPEPPSVTPIPDSVKPIPDQVKPIPIPIIIPIETPDTTPDTTPDITPIITPDITPDITPNITPIITPRKTPSFTPRTFTPNKRTMPPPIIPFTRGGGESAARGFKNFWGAAGLRKQAIPTPKELLEQVGLGKTRFKAKSLFATGNKFFAKPTKSKGKSRRKR